MRLILPFLVTLTRLERPLCVLSFGMTKIPHTRRRDACATEQKRSGRDDPAATRGRKYTQQGFEFKFQLIENRDLVSQEWHPRTSEAIPGRGHPAQPDRSFPRRHG